MNSIPSVGATPGTLTSREAGAICDVSFRTVIRWIERGELPAYRLPGRGDYRIALADLQQFMRKHGLPDRGTAAGASRRVLIVDDDPAMARAIQRVLRRDGCETAIAADGFQAGSLLHTFAPALLTLDLRMPRLVGFGVLRFLRESRPLPSLKVLVVSGEAPKRLQEALEEGADETLAKPFEDEQLLAAVGRLLSTGPARPGDAA